jgi:hypothetical protein
MGPHRGQLAGLVGDVTDDGEHPVALASQLVGDQVERQGQIEDPSWVDLPVPDLVDEVGQEPMHGGRP